MEGKKQIRYFYNGRVWLTEDMYPLDSLMEKVMFRETEEGQMLWPHYDNYEYRADIRFKIL